MDSISADRYERLELIGTGSFGDVYRGWDREAGIAVALKIIDLENVEDDITDIHREVAILAHCKSSNITEYYASVLEPGTTDLLIVMELLACSVCDLLSNEASGLDERTIAFIMRETLKALVYLHENNRIHRDVKSANILLSAHGEVKISDFGVSGQLSKTVAFKRRTFVGSPFWMAPEVIKANTGGDGYGQTADIWSLGITAYEMANGKPPHADLHPMRALFLIPAEDAPRLEGPFSQEFKSFVAQCLQKDPLLRPSAAALLRHPFLAGPHDSGRLAELVHMHGELKREAHISSGQGYRSSHGAPGTARWDFDTQKQRMLPSTAEQQAARGSIRSHQINSFTIRDSTWGATFAKRQLQTSANSRTSDLIPEEAEFEAEQQLESEPMVGEGVDARSVRETEGTSLQNGRAEPSSPAGQEAGTGKSDGGGLPSRFTGSELEGVPAGIRTGTVWNAQASRLNLSSQYFAFQRAGENELLSSMLQSALKPRENISSDATAPVVSDACGSSEAACPALAEASATPAVVLSLEGRGSSKRELHMLAGTPSAVLGRADRTYAVTSLFGGRLARGRPCSGADGDWGIGILSPHEVAAQCQQGQSLKRLPNVQTLEAAEKPSLAT